MNMLPCFPSVSLGQIAEIDREGIAPEQIPAGTKYLGLEHIESGGRILDVATVGEGELASTKFRFGPRHLLFGKLRPYLAKIALPDFEGVCSTDILPVLPGDKLDRRYLAHFLRQPSIVDFAASRSTGANLPRLSPKSLAAFAIPLPPLAEQKRIAAILDQADALRRLRRRALDRLNILGQAIFQEMIGEIRTAGGERYDRPSSLLEISDILIGYPFKSSNYVEGAGTVRLCRGANILPGLIDWSDLACYPSVEASEFASYDLDIGDVVVAMDRPWISSGFKVAQVNEDDLPSLLVQRVARIRARSAPDRDFIYFLLQNPAFQRHCKPTETTVPHISPKDFRSFKFILPPPKLRHAFGAAISGVRRNVAFARASGVWADALFQSLQHRAFTGQL